MHRRSTSPHRPRRHPAPRDPDDQADVDLILATGADALVNGDGDLLADAAQTGLPILTLVQLRESLSGE